MEPSKIGKWHLAPQAGQSHESDKYYEYMMYDNYADPFQHVNLVSRANQRELSQHLPERLIARMVEVSNQ